MKQTIPNNKHTLVNNTIITDIQLYGLLGLRVLIGWHLLYEGIAKIMNPFWSSAAFLLDAKWIFSGVAKWMVSNPSILGFVDNLNINQTMVKSGWAIAYRYYSADYIGEENFAQKNLLGIWRGKFEEPYIFRKKNK